MTPRRAITTALIANFIVVTFAIILGLATGKPSRYFGEGRFTTSFSCLQLLTVAFISSRIFLARRAPASKVGSISAAWVWALIAAGFVFLAADDALEIHERLDRIIHETFQIQETGWTDRLDDAIIGMYGFIGLVILRLFRKEILFFKQIWRPLVGGFLCLLASVVCDTISNEEEFLIWLCGNVATGKRLTVWFAAGDGAFTLLAEGFFLAAFYLAYRTAVEAPHHAMLGTASESHGPCNRPVNPPAQTAPRSGDS